MLNCKKCHAPTRSRICPHCGAISQVPSLRNYSISFDTLLERQTALGMNLDRLNPTEENRRYWLSHIEEEILEIALAGTDTYYEEIADTIIFCQVYNAIFCDSAPLCTSRGYPTSGGYQLLYDLKACNPYRKDWKSYLQSAPELFTAWFQDFMGRFSQEDLPKIHQAYFKKLDKNLTRQLAGDWN